MAGGHMKYRHLNRTSAHRQALLRNLVEALIEHESIKTTWPKAKEAQRLADKMITWGKKNTNASRKQATAVFYRPLLFVPKVFGELRERYADRPGGYTRVLRMEPHKEDQSPSAILELVDGPRDMRFAMTAKTLVRERRSLEKIRDLTAKNILKVTKYRLGGQDELEEMVKAMEYFKVDDERREMGLLKERVYPKRKDIQT
ncbi:hypothetical protein MMC09_006687 [Bachmanniomyces sp. S44760]|nr:hypothetical protein [Bachmanniomyces sp. S44760]